MGNPDWVTVARAVCNMEGASQGLKNKALEKYINDNYQQRIAALQTAYAEWMSHQSSIQTKIMAKI